MRGVKLFADSLVGYVENKDTRSLYKNHLHSNGKKWKFKFKNGTIKNMKYLGKYGQNLYWTYKTLLKN